MAEGRSLMAMALLALRSVAAALVPFSAPVWLATHGLAFAQDATGGSDAAQRAGGQLTEGNALLQQGDVSGALLRFSAALTLFRQARHPRGEGLTLLAMAMAHQRQGQPTQTLQAYEQALRVFREANDRVGEAAALKEIGDVYRYLGHPSQALEYYNQALPLTREVRILGLEGVTLNSMGAGFMLQGQYPQALEHLQRALTIMRQTSSLDGEGTVLDNLGNVYRLQGQYAQALEHLQQALTIARQVGDCEGEGRTLYNIGLVYGAQGQDNQALDYLRQALPIRRQSSDRMGEAEVLQSLGMVYLRRSEYSEALEHLQQALSIMRQVGNRAGEASALNAIGHAYRLQGQYSQALEHLQQTLGVLQEGSDRAREGFVLNSMGEVYRLQGNYGQALEHLQRALNILSQAGNRQGEGATLNEIGVVYRLLGHYEKSVEYLRQSLSIMRAIGEPSDEIAVLTNIGNTYRTNGQTELALEHYQQALGLVRELGNQTIEGTLLQNMGIAYGSMGKPDQALECFQQARVLLSGRGDLATEGLSLHNIGHTYMLQGQYTKALEYLENALVIRGAVGDRLGEALTYRSIGFTYERIEESKSALKFYLMAIDTSEDLRAAARLDEFKTSLGDQFVDLYVRTTLLLLRLGQPTEAFNLAERGRARTFLDQLGSSHLNLSRAADPQRIQQEQALRGEIGLLDQQLRQERAKSAVQQNADLIGNLTTRLAAKQRDYEALLTRLKLADPESASLVSVAPLKLADVQGLLDSDTTLLSYFVTPDETLAFVLSRNAFQTVELPIGEQALRDTINSFRAFTNPTDANDALARLAEWLLAPLADQLTTPVVGIIPHGVLHYLPFAALQDGSGYFGTTHTLFSLPSASILPFVLQKRKANATQLLAIAQSRPAGLPPLHFADLEAAAIARLYGTQPLLDTAATKTAFVTQAPQYTLLHLAAHGELNERAPLFSRIFLGADGASDGSLTVQDVYGLNLSNADLVVLSACETQLGAQSKGDDLVGLNRAFIYAGTPSVIASLWSVDDEATAVLMTAFYQHLRAGLGKAAALQAAQAETRAQFSPPYYWAAFVLTGDPGAPRPSS